MNLEDQVCSLGPSKRLKELGVEQESLCHWQPHWIDESKMHIVFEGAEDWSDDVESYSAFTVGELCRTGSFPSGHEVHANRYWRNTEVGQTRSHVYLRDFRTQGNTEADARAKMLIYLLENRPI